MTDFEFIHEKFYDRVDERKDKLVKLMVAASQKENVFTSIFKNIGHLDEFFMEIKKLSKRGMKDLRFSLIDLNTSDFCVKFKDGKQQIIHTGFLCFQFFDLYQIVNNSVTRYLYFEIYFDDNILGILMKKSTFNSSDRTFPAYDLDRREWSQAKLQMQMWLQFYRVEVEEIQEEHPKNQAVLKYLKLCKKSQKLKKREKKAFMNMLFGSDSIWVFIAYVTMVQILPLFPNDKPRLCS